MCNERGMRKDMSYIDVAKDVFKIEAQAVLDLCKNITDDFDAAINAIISSKGRVIVCGMGKSGIIGKKIAATLASTGTPCFFMHPGEAYHGDLGMVTPEDVFLALSNSGETDEVIKLIPFLRENKNILIAMTGNPASMLARSSGIHLNVKVGQEACPLQLAPTASTTATLAMGDALAVALMQARSFQPENFARFHPGGSLGKRLLGRVDDEMIRDKLPFVAANTGVIDMIEAVSQGSLGLCIIRDPDLCIVTDGDIRRAIGRYGNSIFQITAADIMTPNPSCVEVGTRMEDALKLMDSQEITALIVRDGEQIAGVLKK